MWRDVLAPGRVRERIQHLWRPPDWERAGHRRIYTWAVDEKRHEPVPYRRLEHRGIAADEA
jgi:hypothetical protein